MAKRNQKRKWIQHPCVDETRDGNLYLKIFRFFFPETTLPKYQPKTENEKRYGLQSKEVSALIDHSAAHYAEELEGAMQSSFEGDNTQREADRNNKDYVASMQSADKAQQSIPWWKRWFMKAKDVVVSDTVEETFDKTKNVKVTITPEIESSLEQIKGVIAYAEVSSQGALVATLKQKQVVLASELVLAKHGIDKYVEEADIIEFLKKSKRGVRLDFIRNYTSLLPMKVTEKKSEVDKLMIFDNYAIMYYDPKLSPFVLAPQDEAAIERERKRDPILFGLIKDSRRLYYIIDWITEDDDLTLAALEKELDSPTKRLEKWRLESEFFVDEALNKLSFSLKHRATDPDSTLIIGEDDEDE